MDVPAATFWRRQARRTALRHNLACLLGALLPSVLGVSAVAACTLLVARENGVANANIWYAYGAGLLASLAVAGWRSWPRLFTVSDAFVRLEAHMRLHNRLSAAAAGVGAYPAPQAVSDGYAFRWGKIAPSIACSILLVWGAFRIPVSTQQAPFIPPAPPLAWTQTASWIDSLKKSDALQEPALEDLRDRLEQLHKQPAGEWYSQSSLEAGDNLREQTSQSMQTLQHDLQSALGDTEAMQKFTDGTSAAEMKAVHENMQNALKGLELGTLPLDRDLLDQLKQADLSDLKGLTPGQLEEMKRRLKAGDKVCQACLHPGEMEGKLDSAALLVQSQTPGGKGGGTNSPPLTLNEKPANLETSTTASVSNPNLDHATPGDLMGVGKSEHPVDPAKYTGPQSAGAIASNGDGGDAVWRNDLTPREREVVKKFFK